MSSLEELMFTLKDRDGAEHHYIVTPHTPSQGFAVIDSLLALGVGPICEAMAGAATYAGSAEDEEGAKVAIADMVKAMDIEAMAAGIQKGLVASGGTGKIVPMLLKYTTRDAVPLNGSTNIDIAYTRNLGELARAVRKVIEINGFFDALLGSWVASE